MIWKTFLVYTVFFFSPAALKVGNKNTKSWSCRLFMVISCCSRNRYWWHATKRCTEDLESLTDETLLRILPRKWSLKRDTALEREKWLMEILLQVQCLLVSAPADPLMCQLHHPKSQIPDDDFRHMSCQCYTGRFSQEDHLAITELLFISCSWSNQLLLILTRESDS